LDAEEYDENEIRQILLHPYVGRIVARQEESGDMEQIRVSTMTSHPTKRSGGIVTSHLVASAGVSDLWTVRKSNYYFNRYVLLNFNKTGNAGTR
jgi:hypothetical protein